MQELIEAYPIIKQVGPWVGGALGASLIFLFKNRRPLLTYNVSHSRIGMTADDQVHGRVEVTYRGTVVHNLYLTTVTLSNRSISDLENLELKTFSAETCALLSEQSAIAGSIDHVPHAENYLTRINEDLDFATQATDAGTADETDNKQRIDADTLFRHGQRWYTVPSLNRGQSLSITYLVSAAANTSPIVYVACQTKGVRIKEKPFPQAITHLWGVPVLQAALVGIVAAMAIYGVVIWKVTTLWIAALICVIVGVFANLPGALLIRAYNWLREKLIG